MQPLYLVPIEDLGRSDFVKVDCAACRHVALLTPAAWAQPSDQGARSQGARPLPRLSEEGTGCGLDQVAPAERLSRPLLPAPTSKAGSRANPVTQRRRAVARDLPARGDWADRVRDRGA